MRGTGTLAKGFKTELPGIESYRRGRRSSSHLGGLLSRWRCGFVTQCLDGVSNRVFQVSLTAEGMACGRFSSSDFE